MSISWVQQLALDFKTDWPAIEAGRTNASRQLASIEEASKHLMQPDTSLVVFGSLARGEFTESSDIDWTLLVDGITIPEHLTIARKIGGVIKTLEGKPPGRTGTFGSIASSHNLIHYIGGEDDTNANTTRRSLLLLEARAIGDTEAFVRVRRSILKRYLEEDLGLWRSSTKRKIPHFLLNDFARYWRMMTVDFADKQHDRFHEGFALRNIKLRFSRKLLYISGLLTCFRGQLEAANEEDRASFYQRDNSLAVTDRILSALELSPLENVAEVLNKHVADKQGISDLFTAYDNFLAMLSSKDKRCRLEEITPEELEGDHVYAEARHISHSFAEAVGRIFLTRENPVGELTIEFGVF